MIRMDRKIWLSHLAQAPAARLAGLWAALERDPEHRILRAPETGTVMVQGRMGGTGTAFNMGEMTVTRCSLELAEGPVGHGYVQGRSHHAARCAALVDALMQTDAAAELEAAILIPLQQEAAAKRDETAAKAAATKVDFFTLVRGEDP